MITYEVKVSIDPSQETEWLNWMKTAHVPDVIATGLVRSFQILKPQEELTHTYLFHYHFASQADFEAYQQNFGPQLRDDHHQKYGDKVEASRQIYQWI